MAKTKLKRGDIIQIEWGDAWTASGWMNTKEKDCVPHKVIVVGAFVAQSKEGIIITYGFASDGQNLSEFFAPTGMIRSVKKLLDTKKIKVAKK